MPRRPPAIAQADRRAHPRHSIQLPIRLQPDGASIALSLETCDLSLSGCSVMVPDQLSVGLGVRITLSLPDSQIAIAGRVITRHPHFGNGIMFLNFEEDGETRLRRYLDEETGN